MTYTISLSLIQKILTRLKYALAALGSHPTASQRMLVMMIIATWAVYDVLVIK